MREFAEALVAKLLTVPGNKFSRMWNDQLHLEETKEQYSFPIPAVFPEFLNSHEVIQLGDGVQMYDPLYIRLHVIHQQLDAGDGTMEQNFDVYDFAKEVYKTIQEWMPDNAGAFIRVEEQKDYEHGNIYHFQQDFKTTLIDSSRQRSTDGVLIAGSTLVPVIIPFLESQHESTTLQYYLN